MRRKLAPLLFAAACPAVAPAQATAYTWYGTDSQDYFGQSVRGVGDVDADGVPDIVVGTIGDDDTANYAGSLQVYSGIDGSLIHDFNGDVAADRLARSVGGPGDLNGDGHAEIIAGAANVNINGPHSGMVRVYDGQTGAILYDVLGDEDHDELGWHVNGAGDVNMDGTPDIIAGARQFWGAGGPVGPGYARVLSGVDGALIWQFAGQEADSMFGFSVDGAGDVDMDGFADLIVGAPYEDGVGSDSGAVRIFSGLTGALVREHFGAADGERFGYSVSGAGDVDDDGHDDYIVGAPDGQSGAVPFGYAKLYSGFDGSELFTFWGDDPGDGMGQSVAAAGDVDGDGLPDLAVGADQDDDGGAGAGAAYVFKSDGTLLWKVLGNAPGDLFGYSLDGLGDLNGDGYSDLVVGAWSHSTATTTFSGEVRTLLSQAVDPQPYCTAKLTSIGCLPYIASTGIPSLSIGNNFVISAHNVLNQRSGLLFFGDGAATVPFQGALLCVAPPLQRTAIQESEGSLPPTFDCTGTYALAFDHFLMGLAALQPGDSVYAQYWSRDPGYAAPQSTGLTDALLFTILP